MNFFIVLLSFYFIGTISSLLVNRNDHLANLLSHFFSICGSILGIIFSLSIILTENYINYSTSYPPFPILSLSFNIDAISAFFIFVISLISLFCSIYATGYVRHFYNKYNVGSLGFFYNLFIVGMLLVVTASHGIFFLIPWEIMSVVTYFLVIYEREDINNIKAGFLYLVMTQIGTGFILLSFLLLYKYTGSFDFENIRNSAHLIPQNIKNLIFLFSLIGFGTKAGIIPLHNWLTAAHPAAPAHVSALMSGVMIKTGIYMLIRIYFEILQPVPVWYGLVILVIGSLTAFLGVLYAIAEQDLKRLLAYCSIENIGVILLGLGSSLTFISLGFPSLALVGIIASLFHILNHAIFKSLLFLGAGSIISKTESRNIEEFGGFIKYMPATTFLFFIGCMAISSLPPLNGFFSEWMTFQSLFQGLLSTNFSIKWIFMLSAAALAFSGGLALVCFVKVFGTTFLARSRSAKVEHLKESSNSMLFGMGSLASFSILFGFFSGTTISIIEKISRRIAVLYDAPSNISISSKQMITIGNGFASVSAPVIFISLILLFFLVTFAIKFFVNHRQKVRVAATWDCGTDLTPRMEITSVGFIRSIILIFKGILKPSVQTKVEYQDAETRYLPKSRTVIFSIGDTYRIYLYDPLNNFLLKLSNFTKRFQVGITNIYILYILIALLAILYFAT